MADPAPVNDGAATNGAGLKAPMTMAIDEHAPRIPGVQQVRQVFLNTLPSADEARHAASLERA